MWFRIRLDEWPLDDWRIIERRGLSGRLPAVGDVWTLPNDDGMEEWRVDVIADDPEDGIARRIVLSRVGAPN
jgi:hypothetical protein